MPTKLTVIGETPVEKKPIELKLLLCDNLSFTESTEDPNEYQNVELISRNYNSSSTKEIFDLIFAYDNDRNMGFFYLGHWNDGVVE